MIKNLFTTAYRNVKRNKTFAFINIIGLAIGISAAMVIFLIINYDYNFDKFENDQDRIYRIVVEMEFSGNISHTSGIPIPLCKSVYAGELTGIETASHF